MFRGVSRQKWLLAAVCSLAAVLLLATGLRWHWLLAPAAVFMMPFGAMWFACKEQRCRWFAALFGFLFSLLQLLGARIDMYETIAADWLQLFWNIATAVFLTPAAGGVFVWLIAKIRRVQFRGTARPERKNSKLVFWCSTALLLVCWLPYLLAFYPGLFTYDISWQYQQYQSWNFNTHHPLLHTLLVGVFCDLGRQLFGYPAKGLLLYTLFQMILMAMAMASAIKLLYKHRAPAWMYWGVLLADAILPFHTLLVISSTKDTLFSGAVLYLSVLLAEAVLDRDRLRNKGWTLRFVLTGAAVGLMRNNGFICLAAVAFAASLGLRRYCRPARRLLALSLCTLLLDAAVGEGLKLAVDAEDGHFREVLSVPLQQMARVHHFADDEAETEIEEWLPTVDLYSPDLADLVKNTFDAEKDELSEVLELWTDVGLRNPMIYVDSFLATNEGFYRINAEPTGVYLDTDFHENEGWWLKENTKWPALREKMMMLFSHNAYMESELLSLLLSPALWAWLMMLALWAGIYMRQKEVIITGLVSFALYLTVLLGPCVMVRYIYPIMMTAPLLLGLLMFPEKMTKTKEA